MPTLGDVVNFFFKTLGEGAQHQYATQTRGGGYLAEDRAARLSGMRQAMEEARTMEQLTRERDALRGSATVARGAGFQGSDAEAVSAQQATRAAEAATQAGLKNKSAIAADEALVRQRDRGVDPETLEALRQQGRVSLQELKNQGDLNEARLRAASRPPQIIMVQQPDGSIQAVDKSQVRGGQTVGGRPTLASETRAQGKAASMSTLLDFMLTAPDEMIGPAPSLAAGARGSLPAQLLGVNEASPQYQAYRAASGEVRDLIVHKLTGAAASVPEMARLIQHIPDMTRQRPGQFRANAAITKASNDLAERIIAKQIDPASAQQEAAQLLQAIASGQFAAGSAPASDEPVSDLPGGGWDQRAAEGAGAAPAAAPVSAKDALLKKYGY